MIPGRIPGRERWEVEDKLILSNASDQGGELKIYGGTAGEKALEIFYGGYSIFSILATGSTVQLLGAATKPVQIGDAGTQNRGLVSNDDLFVSGKLEVDGAAFFDFGSTHRGATKIYDNTDLIFGTGTDVALRLSTAQATVETLLFGLDDVAKSIIICDKADMAKDFDHAGQANPTIFIHSAEDPDTANDEWISICHTGTDGLIGCGSGTLNLGGTTVNFVHSTLTGATVTHDAYVTLEIAGVEKKFMLGS